MDRASWFKNSINTFIATLTPSVRLLLSAREANPYLAVPQKEHENEKKHLTAYSEHRNVAPMQMRELLEKVRELTLVRGNKSKLANALSVPLPRISEWLSGKYEPSGETTLKLLHWVEQQEVKQQQSPGSVIAPPEQQTRLPKSYEHKSKPSP